MMKKTGLEKMNVDFINAEWIKKYCEHEIQKETESWDKFERRKNDTWINASHSGKVHALGELKSLIETLETLKGNEQNGKR